jgi:hypothetical protein
MVASYPTGSRFHRCPREMEICGADLASLDARLDSGALLRDKLVSPVTGQRPNEAGAMILNSTLQRLSPCISFSVRGNRSYRASARR